MSRLATLILAIVFYSSISCVPLPLNYGYRLIQPMMTSNGHDEAVPIFTLGKPARSTLRPLTRVVNPFERYYAQLENRPNWKRSRKNPGLRIFGGDFRDFKATTHSRSKRSVSDYNDDSYGVGTTGYHMNLMNSPASANNLHLALPNHHWYRYPPPQSDSLSTDEFVDPPDEYVGPDDSLSFPPRPKALRDPRRGYVLKKSFDPTGHYAHMGKPFTYDSYFARGDSRGKRVPLAY